jgi:hypothetical protein
MGKFSIEYFGAFATEQSDFLCGTQGVDKVMIFFSHSMEDLSIVSLNQLEFQISSF